MFKGGACITFPTPSGLTFSPLGVIFEIKVKILMFFGEMFGGMEKY